jgi:hypothetical protein
MKERATALANRRPAAEMSRKMKQSFTQYYQLKLDEHD